MQPPSGDEDKPEYNDPLPRSPALRASLRLSRLYHYARVRELGIVRG